jgi:hypothetical protein
MVRRASTPQEIVDVWRRTTRDRNKASGYNIHDGSGNVIQAIVPNMDIVLEVTSQGRMTSDVRGWVTWQGQDAQRLTQNTGSQP